MKLHMYFIKFVQLFWFIEIVISFNMYQRNPPRLCPWWLLYRKTIITSFKNLYWKPCNYEDVYYYYYAETPEVGGHVSPQVFGYQLTLFGPRGADYARHITTGPSFWTMRRLCYDCPRYKKCCIKYLLFMSINSFMI